MYSDECFDVNRPSNGPLSISNSGVPERDVYQKVLFEKMLYH